MVLQRLAVPLARAYADHLGYRQLFDEPWRFAKRTRRPPTDPANVLLSLGYTLLALDIMEEFRPVIDGLVLHACRHGLVTLEDLRPGNEEERPLVLEREALKRYVTAYEERMARPILHPRTGERMVLWRFLEVQAREVARCVREGDAEYQATVFR